MDDIKYKCSLCGRPVTLSEPDNPTNGWTHECVAAHDECFGAWRKANPGVANFNFSTRTYCGYWKAYYGVPVEDNTPKPSEPSGKREIIIWIS